MHHFCVRIKHKLEGMLEEDCLSLVKQHYVEATDADTGIKFREPPTLAVPPGTPLTERHLFHDQLGGARLDPDKVI